MAETNELYTQNRTGFYWTSGKRQDSDIRSSAGSRLGYITENLNGLTYGPHSRPDILGLSEDRGYKKTLTSFSMGPTNPTMVPASEMKIAV